MKRPLVVCCILFLAFILIIQTAEDHSTDLPLFQTERILKKVFEEQASVTVSGRITECITLSTGVRLFMDHLTFISESGSDISLLPETKLTFITEQTALCPGDYVQMTGLCGFFSEASNPGQFDERGYYFNRNTVCMLKNPEVQICRTGSANINRVLHQIRDTIRKSFYQILDEKSAGTISAIVLGEKSAMDQEQKTLFQEGGIAHILAVSGLHISMVGMTLYRLLRKVTCPVSVSALLSAVLVFLHAMMTGFGISAVRAVLMFLIWLGAQMTGRKYDSITAAAVAAAVILGRDSGAVNEAAFLLSFSAILVLAGVLPAAEKACAIRHFAVKPLFSCLLVWLGTLPVTVYFFYQTAPWSIVVNFAVIPLMSVVMAAGMTAAAAGMIFVPLGTFLAAPVYYLLNLFEWLCELEQKLPMSVWVTGRPGWERIALFYGTFAGAAIVSAAVCSGSRKKIKKIKTNKIRILWCVSVMVCLLLMVAPPDRNLHVTCLDVGQGDCTLVRLPGGENCLVDAGSTSVRNVWNYRIEDAVKIHGIDTLDYVFLSHADEDHISGVKECLQDYKRGFAGKSTDGITLKNLILPVTAQEDDFAELIRLAEEKGITVLRMQADAVIQGKAGWKITALAPEPEKLSGNKNQDSLVLMLQYKTFRMLFTGDLEGDAEQMLTKAGRSLQADVLKVGHHGSKNSSSEMFLQNVRPAFALISCGEDNVYGHPSPDTVQRLERVGSRILMTPECGAVQIWSDGDTFSVETCLSPEIG